MEQILNNQRKWIALLTWIIIPLLGIQYSYGQLTVTGSVFSSEGGEPLVGVNVTIQGTTQGTITDFDGSFSIEVPQDDAILVFSYVGYLSREIVVGNRSEIDVEMSPDAAVLDEVVVIGYGAVRRSDLTGSVASLSTEEIEKIPISSLEQAMQGRAAGVHVTQSSHAPGGGISVRVRGANSINSQAEPLYVIDGYPIYSNNSIIPTNGPNDGVIPQMNLLSGLNPGDIESIEILKDASATAIYGARGANGVVLITTKRGQPGKSRVEYSTYFGVQEIANEIDMMNAYQFATVHNEMSENTGQPPRFTGQIFDGQYHGTPDEYLQGFYINDSGEQVPLPSTDWQDEVLRTGNIMDHQLSVSGGKENTRYAVSANYFRNIGIVEGGDFNRFSFRTNVDIDATNWLTIGSNINYNFSVSNNSGTETGLQWFNAGTISAALKAWPVFSPYDADGKLNVSGTGTLRGNPVSFAREAKNELFNDRLLANIYANIHLLDGLSFRVSAGADVNNIKRNRYFPTSTYQGSLTSGGGAKNYNFIRSWLNENILTYDRSIGSDHHLNVVAGFTLQQEVTEGSTAAADQFPSDVFQDNNLSAGANQTIPSSSWKNKWSLASGLGRINYNFMEKYLFTVTGRADGSSKFGAENKWAFFPSFAVAWRVINENFMQNQSLFTNLKVRASYGRTGNSEIGLYRSLAILGIQDYTFGEGIKNSGVGSQRMANPDLKWETTDQYDIGLEMGFMNNRLNFIIDFYYKKTTDLLLAVNLPGTAGYTPPVFDVPQHLRNIGKLENKGVEFSMNYDVLVGNFKWNVNGNISLNRNKILELTEGGAITLAVDGINKHGGAVYIDVGLPLGVWRYPVIDGIFKNQQEVEAYVNSQGEPIQPGAQAGDVRYKDVDGDGDYDGDDLDIIGDPNPNFIFGITNSFSYKHFDLIVFINGSQGNDIVAPHFAHAHQMSTISNGNLTAAMWNRWTPNNQNSDVPRAGAVYGFDNNQVFDGSYIRIKNVRLNYNIPAQNVTWLRNAQVFLNIQNLATFTDYIGYDPEVNTAGQTAWQYGIDLNGYPNVKTFMLGFKLGL